MTESYKDRIKKFAGILTCGNALFFGGAGVSTESGLKDFRSQDGIYNTVKEYGIPPEQILSRDFFNTNPGVFYDFYYKYFLDCSALPNDAHISLAKLEKKGLLKSVITQNIDGLHSAAGSKTVRELHGATERYFCPRCKSGFAKASVAALKGKIPYCEKCGSVIETAVTLYGDMLDDDTVKAAIKDIKTADTLIVGGTSLTVYPAAGFIQYFRGTNLILINRAETEIDSAADIVFHESIGKVLKDTLSELS